jgi:radical SAM superfamily enzyme YgiQ (UPF0313 family)
MRYVGKVYRPPSEADAYILQATIGCSWNKCTYCDMYRDKPKFRLRPLSETLEDLKEAAKRYGASVEKIFVTDGDALCMPMDYWLPILKFASKNFPRLRRVSCYAMARNINEKTIEELQTLRSHGLKQLYIGPESGDDITLKRIAKGSTAAEHVEAAQKAHEANLKMSVIFLLGAGGIARSEEHALASAELATKMNPAFLSALTLTVVPHTPLHRLQERGKFILPDIEQLLRELQIFLRDSKPTSAIFRTNHASNYLPLAGILPQDGPEMANMIQMALDGHLPLRQEWMRGL